MTGRESLVLELEPILEDYADYLGESVSEILSDEAYAYWVKILDEKKNREPFTEGGKQVLAFMQKNRLDYYNTFLAKTIGEEIGMSSRTVSRTMLRLISDGYVIRVGKRTSNDPVLYGLTDKGKLACLEEATT
jgi:DNA-binding MarR family transcriptional regulator